MKKLSILLILFFSISLIAQEEQESIVVNYKSEAQIDLNDIIAFFPPKNKAKIEAMYEKELADGIYLDYTLKTNGVESIYQLDEKIDNSQSMMGNATRNIRQAESTPIFKFLNKGIYKREMEFKGLKKYVIEDSLNNTEWNITREKSKILNFEVRKATKTLGNQEITAWFAPKLNIKDGPEIFSGLPGLILKIEFQKIIKGVNTKMIVTAYQVDIIKESIKVEEPKGETITQKEFNEEIDKFIKKMMEMRNQGVDKD